MQPIESMTREQLSEAAAREVLEWIKFHEFGDVWHWEDKYGEKMADFPWSVDSPEGFDALMGWAIKHKHRVEFIPGDTEDPRTYCELRSPSPHFSFGDNHRLALARACVDAVRRGKQ